MSLEKLSFIHPLTHSTIHPLIHSFTHSLPPVTQWPIHSLTHSQNTSFVHLPTHPPYESTIHPLTLSLTHPLIYSLITPTFEYVYISGPETSTLISKIPCIKSCITIPWGSKNGKKVCLSKVIQGKLIMFCDFLM